MVPMLDDSTSISLTLKFFLSLEYLYSSITNFPQVTWLGKSLYIFSREIFPNSNPFVNTENALGEIWAYGLRNPWRFTFAPDGQLIAGDVGQSLYEEVSIIEKGKNYGWNIMEADHCFEPKDNCDQTGLSLPKISYPRDQGISITGGFVYTGEKIPALKSHYIYADFILGNIWAAKYPALEKPVKIFSGSYQFPTFAQDAAGEIYAADYPTGKVFQLVP